MTQRMITSDNVLSFSSMLNNLKNRRKARGFVDSVHARAVNGRLVFADRGAIEGLAQIESRYGFHSHSAILMQKARIAVMGKIDLASLPVDKRTYLEAMCAAGHRNFAIIVPNEFQRVPANLYARANKSPDSDVVIRVHPKMPFETGARLSDGRIVINYCHR